MLAARSRLAAEPGLGWREVLLISLTGGKQVRYLLPELAAIAIIAAHLSPGDPKVRVLARRAGADRSDDCGDPLRRRICCQVGGDRR